MYLTTVKETINNAYSCFKKREQGYKWLSNNICFTIKGGHALIQRIRKKCFGKLTNSDTMDNGHGKFHQ